jgi:hypothetical protein
MKSSIAAPSRNYVIRSRVEQRCNAVDRAHESNPRT